MAALFGADDHVAKRTSKRVDWSRPAAGVRVVAAHGRARRLAARPRPAAAGDQGRGRGDARADAGALRPRRRDRAACSASAPRPRRRSARSTSTGTAAASRAGCAARRSRCSARILCLAQTVGDLPRRGRRRRGLARGAQAQRRLVRPGAGRRARRAACATPRSGRRSRDGDVARVGARGPAAARRRRAPRPHRDRVRRRHRREVAVDLPALRPREPDRDQRRRRRSASTRRTLRDLRRAALLHDIGKLAISNRILDKPARADAPRSSRRIREHPLVTAQILERVPGFAQLAPLASAHHERLDGSGYPRGLAADELDVPMRVLAVADVYEALTSERPYRAAHELGGGARDPARRRPRRGSTRTSSPRSRSCSEQRGPATRCAPSGARGSRRRSRVGSGMELETW